VAGLCEAVRNIALAKGTLLLVEMKEKKLLKIQPLQKVLRVQAIRAIRATTLYREP
jgi:hypothetical protein